MPNITGQQLNERYNLGAAHALYRKNGLWYHILRAFPGILFDEAGFIIFDSEERYRNSQYVKIKDETETVHVNPPGISAIPGYKLFEELVGRPQP